MSDRPYKDRQEAGRIVAEYLAAYRGISDLIILGLPRGGVPVAAEVAQYLNALLDVLMVRKVGLPQYPEVAMGAIAAIAGKVETVYNEEVLALAGLPKNGGAAFEKAAEREREELIRRQNVYRNNQPPVHVTNKTVILVDDGLATGSTMRAAIAAVKQERPSRIVAAVPVGSTEAVNEIRPLVDELICPLVPEQFWAVSQVYESFEQTTDAEVQQILRPRPSHSI